MLIPDRRRRLLDHLRSHGSATIEDLSETLSVSTSTVRRDLALLHAEGLLTRTYGGAFAPSGEAAVARPAIADSQTAHARQAIGRYAASLIENDSTVMVLGGSTTSELVPALHERRLTVVTNGLEVAYALKDAIDITVVIVGGYLHREQMTLLGPMTENAMRALHVDVMIAGAWGVDADTGVTGNKIIQAGNHERMLRHTDRLIVLADATKIGRRGPTLLADIEQVDTLITDSTADPDLLDAIAQRGVRLEIVELERVR